MPPPHLTFDLDVGVGVACDLGYPCAKFRLPRPFGFRVRADVRDISQTDGRTTDADHRLMPPLRGGGIIGHIAVPKIISKDCELVIYDFCYIHGPMEHYRRNQDIFGVLDVSLNSGP